MAGFDHEFTTGSLFGAGAQALMLGNIHRHQSWEATGPVGLQCIAYPGSIGRFHYGEQGEKGFPLWEVESDVARCTMEPTPARRTIDNVFEGKPDLDALQAAIADQEVAGAFVRVRWTMPEEDRHEVDRTAIVRLLAGAAESKLEGRIVPVVRTHAAGISQLADLADERALRADKEPVARTLLSKVTPWSVMIAPCPPAVACLQSACCPCLPACRPGLHRRSTR